MFLSILKWGAISLTIIYLIHHLYMFFLNTLTVPKIKDLVNKPSEQYDEMFKTLQGGIIKQTETATNDKMTEELSSFLNELKKNPDNDGNSNGTFNNKILGANEVDSYSSF